MRRAVILAGGLGTRLRPYTVAIPKPLVPIGNLPILEIVIRQLSAQGFDHVTLAVNHQADLLRAYFGDGSRWNIQVNSSLEPMPLGTMGPLKLIDNLPQDFLVMNGDILSDLNYAKFLDDHIEAKRFFTISAAAREQTIDYGVLQIADDANLEGFEEKPKIPYLVSMGVYALNRAVLDWIPDHEAFGFDQLVLKLLAARQAIKVARHRGYWLDIGRPDDYQKAIDDWPRLAPTMGL